MKALKWALIFLATYEFGWVSGVAHIGWLTDSAYWWRATLFDVGLVVAALVVGLLLILTLSKHRSRRMPTTSAQGK